MDPISSIVTALVCGAIAGLKPTAEQIVKDSYSGLKQLIQRKYKGSQDSLELLEKDPESDLKKAVVEEDLKKTDIKDDIEVLQKVQELLTALQNASSENNEVAVFLEQVEAASLNIKKVISSHTGVHVKDAKFKGDIKISDVSAGTGDKNTTKA